MLKRISHIILSLVLLVSTMGMAVSKHYCQGDLYSVSVDGLNNDKCDMGDCCHDEAHFFKVQEDFYTPQISTIPVLAELDILGHDLFSEVLLNAPEQEVAGINFIETPPLLPIQKTLSLKQVYRL